MPVIRRLHNQAWSRIVESSSVDANTMRPFKEIYLIIFVLFFLPNFLWLASVPDAFFTPPILSFAVLIEGFPDIYVTMFFQILLIVSLALISVDKLAVIGGLLSFGIMIVFFNITYSLGKIDHAILLPVSLLCFSLGGWKKNKNNENYILPIPPETLLAIFIGFGMFTAGFQKALHWIDFDINYSGFLDWFYPGFYNLNRQELLAPLIFKLPIALIETFDYLAVALELSAIPVLLLGKKEYWRIWILVACCFHLANLLVLNIPFTAHVLVYLPYILPSSSSTLKGKGGGSLKLTLYFMAAAQLITISFFGKKLIEYIGISELHLGLLLWPITIFLAVLKLGYLNLFRKRRSDFHHTSS